MMIRATLFLSMILLFANCAVYQTQIESNVDTTQQIDLKKVNLVVEGNNKTIGFLDSLSIRLQVDLKRYGVEVKRTVRHPLELKSPENFKKDYEAMLAEFQPDAIFTIAHKGMRSRYETSTLGKNMSSTDEYSETTFLMEIGVPEAKNMFWKANMVLKAGGDLTRFSKSDSQKTSLKIIKKLQSDGVLK